MIADSHAGLLRGIDTALDHARDTHVVEASVSEVSGWDVCRHLEHLLLADRGIVTWIEHVLDGEAVAGEGKVGKNGPTSIGTLILETGDIPRGRGVAPEPTKPSGIGRERIEAGLADVRAAVEALRPALPALGESMDTREHYALGHLTPARWLRFLDIHHLHHDKIIRDILEAAGDR